jgi:hypothetical protein
MLQADQNGSDARRARNRSFGFRSDRLPAPCSLLHALCQVVRWSEAIERNEADEPFSTAWQQRIDNDLDRVLPVRGEMKPAACIGEWQTVRNHLGDPHPAGPNELDRFH